MRFLNVQKMPPGGNDHNQERARRFPNRSPIIERNDDANILARNNIPENRLPETDENEPFNIIKFYHGREWSEVEHLLQLPPESEKGDDDEEEDWSPAPSQASSDSQDDPFAEDIHDLVNVLDNMIRSQSNLSCDATRVVDYLDLDMFKYETILSNVQNWTWESDEFLSEESFNSSEVDAAPAP
ncbi:uncharacterized protein LOC113403458 [Vanessa tameamea]|uniref:Uncharacterized protein LOC113403458 n=1 Tax=Vanessa tameamea TaxID=334116 RepID=A0A8B8IVV5_VANTA|nr:uncharacterized protein LOC113403458 [Vanessa tameamea]